MDKKPNELHEHLILQKLTIIQYRLSLTQQLTHLITGQPS